MGPAKYSLKELEPEHAPGVTRREVISKRKQNAGLTIVAADVEGAHDWHAHDTSDEVVYVIEGRGRYTFRDAEVTYEAGDFIFIPRGVEHKNVALSGNVRVIAIFNPAIY